MFRGPWIPLLIFNEMISLQNMFILYVNFDIAYPNQNKNLLNCMKKK